MQRIIATTITLMMLPAAASAQSFVSECTLDHVGSDDVLCQSNGVWGVCVENGPNACPDSDPGCRGVPECAIAYCPDSSVRGDACTVAGEAGGCIPLCEVDFSLDCGTGGQDLVCEVGSSGMFDDGEELSCASAGSPGTGFSLFALMAAGIFLRPRRRR